MRYISNLYCKEVTPTIGASFFTCKINVDDIKVIMQVMFYFILILKQPLRNIIMIMMIYLSIELNSISIKL